jgi:phospholipase/carboxylesterase
MPTVIEPQLQTFQNWTFRFRLAQAKPARLLVLVHGWMGDENSMWVFTNKLSPKFTIVAPRGPFSVAEGGYSWREIRPGTWGIATLEDLRPAADALLAFLDNWVFEEGLEVEDGQIDLMGFSQGAAMVYTLTLLHPKRVRRLAALSGFFPENGAINSKPQILSSKPVFVAHGRLDELIPVEEAHRSITILRELGAQITYCESNAAHKVSKDCKKEMELFFGKV